VTNEISEGKLTAMAAYMGLRETPVRVPAGSPAAQELRCARRRGDELALEAERSAVSHLHR